MRLTYKLEKPIDTKYLHYDYLIIADYDIGKGNFGRITDSEIYNKLGQYEDIDESPEHLAKIKRVFDIIREKKIDTEKLRLVANAYAYNNFGKVAVIPITQEEYDLLNEVLYGLPTKQV